MYNIYGQRPCCICHTFSFLCVVNTTSGLQVQLVMDCPPLAGSQGSDTIVPVCMQLPTWTDMHESIYLSDNHYKNVCLSSCVWPSFKAKTL